MEKQRFSCYTYNKKTFSFIGKKRSNYLCIKKNQMFTEIMLPLFWSLSTDPDRLTGYKLQTIPA